jgi:hypothetical protein
MAASLPEQVLYDTTKRRFTEAGLIYIDEYFAKTPSPTSAQYNELEKLTGCSKKTLQVSKDSLKMAPDELVFFQKKFRNLRYQNKGKLSESTVKKPSIKQRPEYTNVTDFLNSICKNQAKNLKAEILALAPYARLINPRNIIDSEITADELSSLTNKGIYDGKSYL